MSFREITRERRGPLLLLLLIALVAGGGCSASPMPPARPAADPAPRIALSDILAAVRKAPAIRTLPRDLTPSLATVGDDFGFDHDKCEAAPAADHVDSPCVFGDPAGSTKVVIYGDSHAGMWVPALSEIARREGVFDWCAGHASRHARGSPVRLFWVRAFSR